LSSLIGLDVGTSSVKGVAVSPDDGEVEAIATAEYTFDLPRPGWSEQDPEDWWTATQTVLAELEAEDEALAIGLSGQMHGLVALDSADQVIRPAILWNDQRTAAECREIEGRVGLDRLIEVTGNRALPGFTAPKLLWLRRHEADNYARIASLLLPKDYVRLRLCGERITDVSDASGTLLFDVASRRWRDDLLDELELDPSWLPPALESPELAGHTPDGVPVAAGAGDQAAGALGVGVDRPGPLSVALGTSGTVCAALESYTTDEQARVHAFCHAVPGSWHAIGAALTAAESVRWLRRSILGGADFDLLMREASGWPPGSEGLLALPYLQGERTPYPDPEARGAFVGLSLRHDRGAMVRAVLEGVAFALRDCLELVTAISGPPSCGRVSGGGSSSDLWLRIVASVLELRLERPPITAGTAYGAALLGGVACGAFADPAEAVAGCVRMLDAVEPDPDWVGPYAEARERFRALYPALREVSGAPPL
jgi:xylulokinase